MYGKLITLRDAVARHKPSAAWTMGPGPNTRSAIWPNVQDRITLWSGFNIHSLNES